MDLGVAGDPSLDVFGSVFPPQVFRYATHHSLEDQSGCSRMVQNAWLCLNAKVFDVCNHQRQRDHHMGLNVTCFVFSDEM